jgi:2-C-methyl-D-erythritol 4-phosphate cytidylyltransferase/2-C-methyl-D-erythritol 2,4-cyclodiphosphate synthase
MHVTAIIAAGGAGTRVGGDVPKQLLDVDGRSLLARSVAAFDRHPDVSALVVVLPEPLSATGRALIGDTNRAVRIVSGGVRRQDSVANAFDAVPEETDIVLVHDAARPFVSAEVITRAIDGARSYGAAIVAVGATDTVKRIGAGGDPVIRETLPREQIFLAQTPQAFRRDVLRDAIAMGRAGLEATDEAALAERAGHPVRIVEGDPANVKITTASDLARARQLRAPTLPGRVGTGYDLHRLVEGRRLVLGGVAVPSTVGALGHSDADVVCHAVTDAILGAASLGDIGRFFPDTDGRWKDASSTDLLRQAALKVADAGFTIVNVDVVVILERPKIALLLDQIRKGLASALGIEPEHVSVKGKTNEGVDAVGRGEAIAAHAVALLREKTERA